MPTKRSRVRFPSPALIFDSVVYGYYQIDDLNLALNTGHLLIIADLKKELVLKEIEKAVRKTGVFEDKRFKSKLDFSNGLKIKIVFC